MKKLAMKEALRKKLTKAGALALAAVVAMGGGRRQASDTIDYSVGFTDMARLGDQVDGQRPLAVIHAKDENSWQDAAKAVKAAIKLADKAPESTPTVYRRISE